MPRRKSPKAQPLPYSGCRGVQNLHLYISLQYGYSFTLLIKNKAEATARHLDWTLVGRLSFAAYYLFNSSKIAQKRLAINSCKSNAIGLLPLFRNYKITQ